MKSSDETQPISFRVQSSFDDVGGDGVPELRYNTFNLKTGRPVAFLSASPRFEELYEKFKNIPSLILPSSSSNEIEEDSDAKNALPKESIEIFTKLLQPTNLADVASVAFVDENLDNERR